VLLLPQNRGLDALRVVLRTKAAEPPASSAAPSPMRLSAWGVVGVLCDFLDALRQACARPELELVVVLSEEKDGGAAAALKALLCRSAAGEEDGWCLCFDAGTAGDAAFAQAAGLVEHYLAAAWQTTQLARSRLRVDLQNTSFVHAADADEDARSRPLLTAQAWPAARFLAACARAAGGAWETIDVNVQQQQQLQQLRMVRDGPAVLWEAADPDLDDDAKAVVATLAAALHGVDADTPIALLQEKRGGRLFAGPRAEFQRLAADRAAAAAAVAAAAAAAAAAGTAGRAAPRRGCHGVQASSGMAVLLYPRRPPAAASAPPDDAADAEGEEEEEGAEGRGDGRQPGGPALGKRRAEGADSRAGRRVLLRCSDAQLPGSPDSPARFALVPCDVESQLLLRAAAWVEPARLDADYECFVVPLLQLGPLGSASASAHAGSGRVEESVRFYLLPSAGGCAGGCAVLRRLANDDDEEPRKPWKPREQQQLNRATPAAIRRYGSVCCGRGDAAGVARVGGALFVSGARPQLRRQLLLELACEAAVTAARRRDAPGLPAAVVMLLGWHAQSGGDAAAAVKAVLEAALMTSGYADGGGPALRILLQACCGGGGAVDSHLKRSLAAAYVLGGAAPPSWLLTDDDSTVLQRTRANMATLAAQLSHADLLRQSIDGGGRPADAVLSDATCASESGGGGPDGVLSAVLHAMARAGQRPSVGSLAAAFKARRLRAVWRMLCHVVVHSRDDYVNYVRALQPSSAQDMVTSVIVDWATSCLAGAFSGAAPPPPPVPPPIVDFGAVDCFGALAVTVQVRHACAVLRSAPVPLLLLLEPDDGPDGGYEESAATAAADELLGLLARGWARMEAVCSEVPAVTTAVTMGLVPGAGAAAPGQQLPLLLTRESCPAAVGWTQLPDAEWRARVAPGGLRALAHVRALRSSLAAAPLQDMAAAVRHAAAARMLTPP
jgi:hypothetical protein